MCLEALSIQAFPGGHLKLEISLDVSPENGDACLSNAKASATPIPTMIALQESDMPFVKFPAVSKMQLRNKVREMSDFVDNHRQVSGFLKLEGKTMKGMFRIALEICLPPAAKTTAPHGFS
ncbi:hypothetical protein OIU79_006156 [Salix purpurea]|uniref:Chromatin assembly factor 1 subunit Cac1-like C-terminal domain-containing protein n=1 Tax=Salix purpurea TaxID=77065 RepID=A0A9Q0TUR2_SALPP|nr:hypothetical protein OIU79_006156 [Salix purpurea]